MRTILRWCFGLTILMLFMRFHVLAETRSPIGGPQSQDDGVVRFTVHGEFRGNINDAGDSALLAAQERLRDWLAKQDPPIRHVPSKDTIRREMIQQRESPQEEPVLDGNQYKITLTVEMRPTHVRALRSLDRTVSSVWLLGGVLAILGVVAIFFRMDEWTKGYLTHWLIAGGIAIIAGLIVALILR